MIEKILLDLAEDVIRVNPNRKQEFKEMIIVPIMSILDGYLRKCNR